MIKNSSKPIPESLTHIQNNQLSFQNIPTNPAVSSSAFGNRRNFTFGNLQHLCDKLINLTDSPESLSESKKMSIRKIMNLPVVSNLQVKFGLNPQFTRLTLVALFIMFKIQIYRDEDTIKAYFNIWNLQVKGTYYEIIQRCLTNIEELRLAIGQKNTVNEEALFCMICKVNKVAVLCLPCGHLVTCGCCGTIQTEENCPSCDLEVTDCYIINL